MGTHAVVVWVGTKPGHESLFTITAWNADGDTAKMIRVEQQVTDAGFVEDFREEGLTKERAEERKREVRAQYESRGYTHQPRHELPQDMM